MRFGVRLPGPFFATFGRTARGQARRNLQVRAHERDILAGHRTLGEKLGQAAWLFLAFFFVSTALIAAPYFAWHVMVQLSYLWRG